MYVKLFASMFDGSLGGKRDELLVFLYMLARADSSGVVDVHPKHFVTALGISLEEVKAALLNLESPDPDSRTPDEEGRRIIRLDEHRDWGWWLVNYEKYKQIRHADDRRESNRVNQQASRARRSGQQQGYVYYVYVAATGIKIAFSANPWARVAEMKRTAPEAILLATERGSQQDEISRHEQFSCSRSVDGWFRVSTELIDHIAKLELQDGATVVLSAMTTTTTTMTTNENGGLSATSAHTDTDTDTDTNTTSFFKSDDCENKYKFMPDVIRSFSGLPKELISDDFRRQWIEWEKYLHDRHDRVMGLMQRDPAWRELVARTPPGERHDEFACSTIRQAISNNWKGLYPKEAPKRDTTTKSTRRPATPGHYSGLQAPAG